MKYDQTQYLIILKIIGWTHFHGYFIPNPHWQANNQAQQFNRARIAGSPLELTKPLFFIYFLTLGVSFPWMVLEHMLDRLSLLALLALISTQL